MNLLRLCHR